MKNIKKTPEQQYQIFFFTGGPGKEAEISRQSYDTYYRALKTFSFLEVHTFDGNPDRTWKYTDNTGKIRARSLTFHAVLDIISSANNPLVVPVIHGLMGEDGTIAAIFESMCIPYLFSSSNVCSLTLNKFATCRILASFGINVPDSTLLFRRNAAQSSAIVKKWLSQYSTLVLKPLDEGSSIDMIVSSSIKTIADFLDIYWKSHHVLLLEEYIQGQEYTVGVYEKPQNGDIHALPPIYIKPLRSHYFDYEAKYVPGKAEETFNLTITAQKADKLCKTALKISEILQISGLARSDFIYNPDSEAFYFLEINTIPGLTANSLVPKSIEQAGFDPDLFLARLLATAFRDYNERKNFLSCFK